MTSRFKTFLSISVVILLTTFFHYIGWLIPIENIIRNIITPVSQTMYNFSLEFNGTTEKFSSVLELENAYKNLKNKNIDNEFLLAKINLLESENSELREQLGFIKKTNYQTLGAEVIGKNVDSLGNTIIINKGSQDNLRINEPVIVGNGILVGKINKVEKNNSVIRLINDNQSKIAATVLNQERSLGLVEGGYGISVYLNFIPQNEVVKVGEVVVTSGLELGVPKGLLLGKVEAVEKEAYQPFQKAVITPFVDLEKILEVSVILN